ncbi:MAG: nucleotidyltransferase [Rhodocyclales bacterium]|nr:nucleotidyltransferase [Rhodocyclales bacterium]
MNAIPSLLPLADEVDDLARRTDAATDVGTLAELASEARGLAIGLIDQDAGAGIVTHALSALNDRLTRRLVALVAPRHRLPAAGWCWLTMGSEGRGEQTFVTDQDNGLVFSAADHAEARMLRPLFLAMAREVNNALDACGFPLCKGGIMAGNEQWCLSVEEWQRHFSAWILTPEPQALLNATIFFDFRAQHGDESLALALRQHLQRLAPQAAGFLHMMAANAVAVEPPLGRLRDFVSEEGQQGRVDLKKHGSRLFVDAARVFALSAGIASVATVPRLRESVLAVRLNGQDMAAAVLAFRHLQRIRLLDQHRKLAAGQVPDNLLDPDTLNALDRRILVESLKQARRLQHALQQTFRLEGL